MIAGQAYSFVVNFLESWGYAQIYFRWSTPTMAQITIPSNYFYYTKKVASSPYQITVNCPTGYSGSVASSPTKCITVWGDGVKAGTEVCDDGNTVSGDGWSADWGTVESGFICSGGSCSAWNNGKSPDSPKTSCIIQWGDGLRAGSEVCDDGNASSGDGCSSDWLTIESGYIWTGGSLTSKDTCIKWSAGFYPDSTKANCITTWGDGLRAGSEVWDDTNFISGDGWSSDCTLIESGWIWIGGSKTSQDTCTKCTSGFYPNSSKIQWITLWGDGLRAGNEKWDDGNTSNGDGWLSDWSSVESGWVCSGGSPTSKDLCSKCGKGWYQNDSTNPTKWITKWGDGIRQGDERWDDGNVVSGDGWASDCMLIEPGWSWYGGWFGLTDVWVQWDLGYDPNTDYSTCIGAEAPRDVKALSAAAELSAYLGVSSNLLLTVFSSSSSSSSNSFGMINQIQLVIIFPLIGPYLPQKIYDYLKSMSTSLFNLDFLPTSNSENTVSFKSLFDYKQQNSYLYLLQLKSGSAFVNILDLTTTVGFAIGVHIILLIIYAILHKLSKLQWLNTSTKYFIVNFKRWINI